ncbi:MAG: hypothetical protein EZS28_019488 [Streblomastix strix]|uniref:C2 domain-containing protein n=1 Tax=Streblomastix strix TaxID=222440 RepID=A0A5J4VS10_9EUKA|nr:MAG: hypothetical protein EZS28_019488 [Streblomastix strix]
MAQRKLRIGKSSSEQDEQEEEEPIQEESRYVNGVVKFSNISVHNLKKMDAFGKSDPFVVFRAGDEEQKTTTAKNTLDYDYTNEEYDLIYNPLKMQGKKEVEVEVWDYDSVGSNDLIGTVSVDQ